MLVGYVCMRNRVESHSACKNQRTRILAVTASKVKYEHQKSWLNPYSVVQCIHRGLTCNVCSMRSVTPVNKFQIVATTCVDTAIAKFQDNCRKTK